MKIRLSVGFGFQIRVPFWKDFLWLCVRLYLSLGGRRRQQVESTDALVIQLTPCCQSVLAVMLAKAGVSAGLPTIGFEPMTLAV